MNVFIDAQIYLNFYPLRDEWELFDKVIKLKKEKKIEIIFPQITYDEIVREVFGGRKNDKFFKKDEKKVYESISINLNLNKKNAEELGLDTKEIEKILDELNEIKKKKFFKYIRLRLGYAGDFVKRINKLKSISPKIDQTEDLFDKAMKRHWLGNPPSKNPDPIGDNLVWKIILNKFTEENYS